MTGWRIDIRSDTPTPEFEALSAPAPGEAGVLRTAATPGASPDTVAPTADAVARTADAVARTADAVARTAEVTP
jgi:hypothetical protein